MTNDLRTTKGPSPEQAHIEALNRKEQRRLNHEATLREHAENKARRQQRHAELVATTAGRKEAKAIAQQSIVEAYKHNAPLPEQFVKAWRLALWHITNEAMRGDVDAKAILDAAFAINPRLVSTDFLSVPPHVLAAVDSAE